MEETPASAPVPPPVTLPLPAGLAAWILLAGIANMVAGVLQILSCVGLPTGILHVMAGATLLSAQSWLRAERQVDPATIPFLLKLRTFFMLLGIATLLKIAFTLVLAGLGIGLGAGALSGITEHLGAR